MPDITKVHDPQAPRAARVDHQHIRLLRIVVGIGGVDGVPFAFFEAQNHAESSATRVQFRLEKDKRRGATSWVVLPAIIARGEGNPLSIRNIPQGIVSGEVSIGNLNS